MDLTHELSQKHKTLDKDSNTFVQGLFSKSVNLSENLGISKVWDTRAMENIFVVILYAQPSGRGL